MGLDVSHHGGSAYPHDKGGTHAPSMMAGQYMTPDMVQRQIQEAIAALKASEGNGNGTGLKTE